MPVLSKQQRIEVVQWYYSSKSVVTVQRHFYRVYGYAAPASKNIRWLVAKFEEEGNVADKRRGGRPVTVRSEENIAAVTESLNVTPTNSLRQVANDLSIKSHKTAFDIAHAQGIRAYMYKPTTVHHMRELDYQRRQQFCTMLLQKLAVDPRAVDNILFSDESSFCS